MVLINALEAPTTAEIITLDDHVKNSELQKNLRQAGAELCQAQFKLGLSKQALANLFSKDKLSFPSLGSFT